jgi:hypothetical protein
MSNPYAMIISAAVQAGSGIVGSIVGAAGSRRRERRLAYAQGKQMQIEAKALAKTAARIRELIDTGGMSLEDGLARIESHFQEQGGALNDWFQEQMQLGTEQLQKNREMVVGELRRNIDVAKKNVDRQQRNYLEAEEKKLDRIEKEFRQSNKQVKEQLTNERLGNSGAFIASVQQSQKTFGDIQNQLGQSKSQYFRGLSEGFTDVVQDAGFKTQQAGKQFDIAATGLQAQLGGQLRQGQMALGQQKFGAEETQRQKSFEIGSQLIDLDTQSELKTELGEQIAGMGSKSGRR